MSGGTSKNLPKPIFGINFKLRRKKNFSLILLAGLSALLCALYYTNYYPGTVWSLRFGVTSFTNRNNATNSQQQKDSSSPEMLNTDAASIHNLQSRGASVRGNEEGNLPSISSATRRGLSNLDSGVSNSSLLSPRRNGRNNHHNNNDPAGDGGENSREISTPKEWNWKYWASLKYWQVNTTTNDQDISTKLEGKLADFPKTVTLPSGGSMSDTSVPSASRADFLPTNREGLACKFPQLNPFDPSITEFLNSPPDIDCIKDYPLVFRTNFRNKLIQMRDPFSTGWGTGEKRKRNYTCCYKSIKRGTGSDHNITFSQKCYPILKAEMVIPATHEFISVRCRIHGDQGKHPKGPSQDREDGTTNNYNNIGNNNSSNNNTSKVYKDMMAFVPLKPRVEDRIRKYEESKRKQVYSLKKAISNKIEVETNGRRGKEINTQQKLQQGKKDSRFYHHKELHSTNEVTNKNHHQPNQVEADGSELPAVNQDRLSVLILGLDAQSHMNFIRQMPRSYTFLRKTLSAIGMQGYTKIGDNTFPNVVASLSGLSVGELEKICWPTKQSYFDSCPFIWKKFAESGYRTSLAEDSVWMATFNYDKKGFLRSPTDYYLHPLSLLMAKKIGHETWGNAKLCYGPRLAFEVLLDYIVKTAVTFKDSLYFQFVWSNSIFHDYLNYPKLGDILLESTMKFLFNNGFLNNTAFILLSDHGIRWGGIRSTYQGKIEERMPVVYFTFPEWFRNKYPHAMRNLRKNAMRLTTPYDVHETLQDILRLSEGKRVRFDKLEDDDETNNDINSYNQSRIMMSSSGGESGESSESIPRGISLFREIPLSRTCRIAGVDQHWCVCDSMENVPANSTLVLSGAQFIVQVINGLLKHSELCAKLLLFKINEAKRKIDGDIDRGLEVDFFAGKSERDTSDTSQYTTTGGTDTDNLQDGNEILRENDNVKRSINPRFHFQKTENAGIAEGSESKTNGNDTGESASIISTIVKEDNASFTLSTSSDIKKIVQLQITLVTRPGDAVFEATIYGEVDIGSGLVNDQDIHQEDGERSHHRWKLAGDISRLNLYGEQSSCITDSKIAKYCFCTKYLAE